MIPLCRVGVVVCILSPSTVLRSSPEYSEYGVVYSEYSEHSGVLRSTQEHSDYGVSTESFLGRYLVGPTVP